MHKSNLLLYTLSRDKLVDKMYAMNRAKLTTQAKGQNQGFASELGGYEFKPRMNKTSLDLGNFISFDTISRIFIIIIISTINEIDTS